jgi:acyl-coenzyme A thioesterase PaaI-like protein
MVKQANSRSCFVCGIENPVGLHLNFYETDSGEVIVNFTAPEQYQSYPGILHGGIVAAILDETAGRANMHGNPPRFMFTAKLEIHYRKNVPIGQPLKIIGKAGKVRSRIAESWAGIYGTDGTLLAEANALYMDIPNQPDATSLDSFGWKVYPDN